MNSPSLSVIAGHYVDAILEGEDPKEFLKRHAPDMARAAGEKRLAEYDLEDCGIDHNQDFPGRTTYPSNHWDEVYVGVGDNPHESIEDALDQAAQNGWPVDAISTVNFPDHPSVAEEYPDDEEGSMQYYTALYVREPAEGEQPLGAVFGNPTQEAEDPKSFFKRLRQFPSQPATWPEIKRWQKYSGGWNKNLERRRAFHMRKGWGYGGQDAAGQAIYNSREYRQPLRNTRFYRHKDAGEHWLEFHRTNVLTWNRQGDCIADNGGYYTVTTRDRMNAFLPSSWRIHTLHGEWFWYNHEWPQNIRDRLQSDVSARRRADFPWWIPFTRNDYITVDGTLVFGKSRNKEDKRGLAQPSGELKLEAWPALRPPPEGVLAPPRRRRGGGYAPNQLQMNLEGRYLNRLARWKRIQAKHDTLKEVEKRKRDLEKVDEPDKKKPKKGHQHLR